MNFCFFFKKSKIDKLVQCIIRAISIIGERFTFVSGVRTDRLGCFQFANFSWTFLSWNENIFEISVSQFSPQLCPFHIRLRVYRHTLHLACFSHAIPTYKQQEASRRISLPPLLKKDIIVVCSQILLPAHMLKDLHLCSSKKNIAQLILDMTTWVLLLFPDTRVPLRESPKLITLCTAQIAPLKEKIKSWTMFSNPLRCKKTGTISCSF